jgi:hypothetical protein
VAWPQGRVVEGKAVEPELLFCDHPSKANEAFKEAIKLGIEAEVWESGLGITRRHTAGSGRLTAKQGLKGKPQKFEAGYKEATKQKPPTTIEAPAPKAPATEPAKAATPNVLTEIPLTAEEQAEMDAPPATANQ